MPSRLQLRQRAGVVWHRFKHGRPADPGAPLPPLHLRPLPVLLVFVGGCLGTLARYELSTLPMPNGLPVPTFFVNILGAFLLGVLLEALLRGGADAGWRQSTRLLLGTGFMGGFTTYSTFTVEVATLTENGRYVAGFGYAILSLLLGVGAAALGVWVSANLAPVPKPRPAADATALAPDESGPFGTAAPTPGHAPQPDGDAE